MLVAANAKLVDGTEAATFVVEKMTIVPRLSAIPVGISVPHAQNTENAIDVLTQLITIHRMPAILVILVVGPAVKMEGVIPVKPLEITSRLMVVLSVEVDVQVVYLMGSAIPASEWGQLDSKITASSAEQIVRPVLKMEVVILANIKTTTLTES